MPPGTEIFRLLLHIFWSNAYPSVSSWNKLEKKFGKYQYQFIKPVRLVTCCCQPKIGFSTDLGPSFALLLSLIMMIINHLSYDTSSMLAASQLKTKEKISTYKTYHQNRQSGRRYSIIRTEQGDFAQLFLPHDFLHVDCVIRLNLGGGGGANFTS